MAKKTTKGKQTKKSASAAAVEKLGSHDPMEAGISPDVSEADVFYKARIEKAKAGREALIKRYDQAIAFYEKQLGKAEKAKKTREEKEEAAMKAKANSKKKTTQKTAKKKTTKKKTTKK